MFIAPYVPSPPQVIRQMLILAQLKPEEKFFDLGAGDGRTVIIAAKDFGARAVGVELREDLAKKALSTVHRPPRVTQLAVPLYEMNSSLKDFPHV